MAKKKAEPKPFTWGDLKRVVNNLSEDFLEQEVRWWGEERGGKVNCVRILEETYVKDDECYEPLSSFEQDYDGWDEGSELPKGSPIIDVD